ncbi:hypothetical protein BC833DRAFT_342278 [Globomyces pollinis-pini]|nr:hypothetical protein BC833DRAFT_342278 [Globomyces pollinis-pini]
MPRVGYSPDILADCCILLNQVTRNYPPAMQSFSELGGLSVLLQSSEVLSTAYSSIGSMPTHARKQSTVSPSRRTSVISPKKIEIPIMEPVLITIDNEQETFRTVSMDQTSLSHGAFGKFYEPSFSDKLDTAPVPVMKGHISKLLTTLQKIDRLLNMNNSFNTGTDILHCLDQFITDSRNLLHVDTLLLYKIDLDTNELFPFTGEYESETIKYPLGHGLAGYCAELGELINVKSPASSPRFSMDIDCPDLSIPAHSLIAVPIFSSKRVVGVLLALNKMGPAPDFQQIHFDEEDEYFVKSLSFIAGIMLGNAKIIDSMKNTQKKVTVLLDTTRSLASILDLDTLIKRIMDSAKELLSSDRCTLFLHDPERKQLRALIQGRDSVQEIRIPSNAGIAGAAFTSGDAINIPNAYKDSRFNPEVDKQTGYVTRTILCMPIKNIHGQCIGVTQMINKRSGIYSLEDEMILSSFSSQAAVAIEKSQLFKKTEDMRIYLQSILSSITSCVITLSESMKVNTVNRMWFFNAIGYDEAFVRENPAEKWLASNTHLLKDIRQVYKDQQTIYVTDFEIKGKGSDAIVNYQIMPLIGGAGVVLVLDDISSEKRAVQTLGRYMSPALAKQVMEEGSGQLGGKRKKVSILFSDIRSFTTLSEHMDPPEVVDLLNHHFTDAVNAITEEQGILDKFIGDAVMAVFGVPFSSPDDAIHACNTALKMKDALVVTNRERASQGKRVIKIGIGVNTGMVLSGNIGSVKRMEFSCIGDAVNLASRTEGLTKFYGITILVTEFTLQETNDLFFTREVEPVIVSGKKLSVRMYELLGKKSDYFEEKMIEACKCYQIGFDFYVRRMFPQAIELFENAIEKNDDGPSKVLVSRCKAYMEEPPPDDWNGVYTAEGK